MKNQKFNRRNFLKLASVGAAAPALSLVGCNNNSNSNNNTNSIHNIPTDKMTYRTSPTTGDKVSLLGYGCMRWPTRPKPGGNETEVEIDQETVNQLIDYAINHGVNFFDTSPAYVQGLSEDATGIALSRHPRNKYFVSTKMSNFSPETQSHEESINLYKSSMKALRVDYLDYYLLHAVGVGGMQALRERYLDNGILDFMLNERKEGRIRNLGFSYHGDIAVFDYLLAQNIKWDFVLIQLNYVDWKHAAENNTNADYLYGELEKRGISALVMEPLLGGRLSKLPTHLVNKLKQRRPNDSVASWAMRFSGSQALVLSVLSGMTYMENLQDNIRTYSPLEPVSEDEKVFLENTAQLLLKYPTVPCNDCKYCMPCKYGLDIPAILTHYNKCINEGSIPDDSKSHDYTEARRNFLIGYDRTVPKLRQASQCIGCDLCAIHCPQGIKISEELKKIDNFVEQLKQSM